MVAMELPANKLLKPASKVPVEFKLHAPHAKRVHVAGEFTDWLASARPLRRKADGSWFAEVHIKPGRYHYKFIVDDEWQNDPASAQTEPDAFGGVNNIIDVKELQG